MRIPRTTFPMAAVAVSSLLAVGCPGDDGESESGGDDATTATTNADTGAETAVATEGATGDETGEPGCGVPVEDWAAPDWETNAAEALAIRAQLDALTGDMTMRGAETGAVVVELADLTAAWDGDPSLAAVANPGYVPVVEACFDEFLTIVAAGDQELVDMDGLWAPGPDGGIWGDDDRGINEGGLEVRQFVDKGGYSAAINYAYALSLTEGEIGPETIEAIAAAWGANATLDPLGDLTDGAGYSYQMGFHADMAAALTEAKTYAAREACTEQRDQALVTFFDLWERSMMARLVFYGNRAEGKLLMATNGTELAGVLHDIAEGVALAAAFIELPDPDAGPLAGAGRIITDDQVLEMMDAFGVDLADLGASRTGLLVESLPNLEDANTAAEMVVMDVYGVDQATIMTYAMPTPG